MRRFSLLKHVRLCYAARIKASGGLARGLVIGCGEVGLHAFFPSGYVLLGCKLTGLVSCSYVSGTLVRLHFARLSFV